MEKLLELQSGGYLKKVRGFDANQRNLDLGTRMIGQPVDTEVYLKKR